MSKILKIAVAAVALSLSTSPIAVAFAASAGDQASCASSQPTPHGVWDCR
ncbi:MAG TPA: hypothetical protein PKE16_05340 [Hyphomicrobium sp.]|nr:hypothetical protein [Hyphomicrobium sp.]